MESGNLPLVELLNDDDASDLKSDSEELRCTENFNILTNPGYR